MKDIYHNNNLFLVYMYSKYIRHPSYMIIKRYYHQPERNDLIHVKTEVLTY
jgi:hypothetical protein